MSSQQMTIFFLGYNIHSESYDVSYVVSFFCTLFHWILFYNNFIVFYKKYFQISWTRCWWPALCSWLCSPSSPCSTASWGRTAGTSWTSNSPRMPSTTSVRDCHSWKNTTINLKWRITNHIIFQISCGLPARCTTSTSSVSIRRLNLQSTLSRGTSSPSKMIQGSFSALFLSAKQTCKSWCC